MNRLFSKNRELEYEVKKKQECHKDFIDETQKVNGYLKEKLNVHTRLNTPEENHT